MTERRGRVSEFRPRRFRRYPDCKDSGVVWLGEIPRHWEIRRLKTLCVRSALYGANVTAGSYSV